MRCSSAWSGPSPIGSSTTTVRKKPIAVPGLPPCRSGNAEIAPDEGGDRASCRFPERDDCRAA